MNVTSSSRRAFLATGVRTASAVALCNVLPRPLIAQIDGGAAAPVPPVEDPRIKAFVLRGVDAARAAGAVYADVRLSHTIERQASEQVSDQETLHVGVRALVDGYWGFASGPVWSADEVVRLGREAVRQSRVNAGARPRTVDLVPAPPVLDGHWVMPVEIEPLLVHPLAIRDYLSGLAEQIKHEAPLVADAFVNGVRISCSFWVQERAFGATNGSYCTQRLYRTEGQTVVIVTRKSQQEVRAVDLLTPAGVGWELFRHQPIRETALQLIAEILRDFDLPWQPVDVGHYNVVLDAQSVARLVSRTIGAATELDRALGYEANAGGTSYLSDPFVMLDTFAVGTPALTVTANRSIPGGAATVRWDDEGVVPDEITLVERGILRDFHTTRESAGWFKAAMPQRAAGVRSRGCAYAPTAVHAPLAHTANLALAPANDAQGFDELVAGLDKGLEIRELDSEMDFQQLNGFAQGRTYDIRKGKRVARIVGAASLFRTPELWKSITAFGGQASVRRFGQRVSKGEPEQTGYHSVTAVPAAFKEFPIVDIRRRA